MFFSSGNQVTAGLLGCSRYYCIKTKSIKIASTNSEKIMVGWLVGFQFNDYGLQSHTAQKCIYLPNYSVGYDTRLIF